MKPFTRLREILAALNLNDDLPLDEDLTRLIIAAERSDRVACFIRDAIARPAEFEALWDHGPDELLEELRLSRVPWSKVHGLIPQLSKALAILES